MEVIHYATQNKAKVGSLERALKKYGIEVIHFEVDLSLSEPRINDLNVIAREKVITAFQKIQQPVVALDAGFFIHSLKGFPGVFVNYALETIGLEGILKLLEGKSRMCEFRECLAFWDGKSEQPLLFESNVAGILSKKPRGGTNRYSWSILATVFIPTGERKTLAEMKEYEYLDWSEKRHQERGSYATKFAEWFLAQKEAG